MNIALALVGVLLVVLAVRIANTASGPHRWVKAALAAPLASIGLALALAPLAKAAGL